MTQAPKQFVEDFRIVIEHYGLPPEEIEEARNCARRDMENAIPCYAAMAKEIQDGLV